MAKCEKRQRYRSSLCTKSLDRGPARRRGLSLQAGAHRVRPSDRVLLPSSPVRLAPTTSEAILDRSETDAVFQVRPALGLRPTPHGAADRDDARRCEPSAPAPRAMKTATLRCRRLDPGRIG